MFAANPEMWQEMYGEPEETGVFNPANEEEFEEMLREWEADGFIPPAADD